MWLSWLEYCPVHQKFAGSVPGQHTYVGCGDANGRQPINVSLLYQWLAGWLSVYVSLSLSLPPPLFLPLSLKSINIKGKKCFKRTRKFLDIKNKIAKIKNSIEIQK